MLELLDRASLRLSTQGVLLRIGMDLLANSEPLSPQHQQRPTLSTFPNLNTPNSTSPNFNRIVSTAECV